MIFLCTGRTNWRRRLGFLWRIWLRPLCGERHAVKLKCANCRGVFTATPRQERSTRWAKKWQPKFGYVCSPECQGKLAVSKRIGVTPLSQDVLARCQLNNATSAGKLKRPIICERCGSEPGFDRLGRSRIHGHHPDHKKPLEVEWICYLCHIEITPPACGTRSASSKLTAKKVRRIRAVTSAGGYTLRELGRLFGVTPKAIADVRDRKTWKHL